MKPVSKLNSIIESERKIEGDHVVALLLVKPSDSNANEYIEKFNYYHYLSDKYVSIYLIGYSNDFCGEYPDAVVAGKIDNRELQYSDKCFIETCNEIKDILKNWNYSGEPELIVLQNRSANNPYKVLDFSNYNYIDINYGIEKGYLDSFPRFMERFIRACKKEVEAYAAIKTANRYRIKPRNVIEYTIELTPKISAPVKKILKDRLFYKSSNCRSA